MMEHDRGRHRRIRIGVLALVVLTAMGTVALVFAGRGGPAMEGGAGAVDGGEHEPLFGEDVIDWVVEPVAAQVEAGAFAGATMAMGVAGREVRLVGMGNIGWTRNASAADPLETMYDLASLTKVVATASAVMLLVDEGRMWLDDPVWVYLSEFREGPRSGITIRHLLTHTSGLPAGAILRGDTREQRIARALSFSIYPPAGARTEYSDVGYIVLWEAAQRAAGEPLTDYLERRLYRPLGMRSTRFSPGLDCEECAPTGRLRDQSLYRGRPFDPTAQRLDGVSGNSGLFSTAHDLARFAAMITNGGELDGVRIFEPETAREFLAAQPVGGAYRLGWEVYCPEGERAGEECSNPLAIGHTGWTGTSLWIDPESGVWVILLTNRTYEPRAPNRIQEVRRELFSRATSNGRGRAALVAAPDAGGADPAAPSPAD
jgi:CubicO group peptidase (beta-lactamase class C family)